MADQKIDLIKQKALEEENKLLRQKLVDSERLSGGIGDRLSSEIKKIRLKGKSSANIIEVHERHDHKNISLWTRDGKRIGPLHPDNAIQALQRFSDLGISLSSDMPTADEIAAYKETPEYKRAAEREAKRRATKQKSKRSGQMEKLAAEIARMSGTTVEAINKILKASEVGKK